MATTVATHSPETAQAYDLLVNGIAVPFQEFDIRLDYVDADVESDSDRKRSYYRGEGTFVSELPTEYAHDVFVDFGDNDAETISMFLRGQTDSLWLTSVSIDSYERHIGVSKPTKHKIAWSADHVRFAD